ncbi:MAG: hypothetical protein E5Y50_30700 [Mesorhizobium sp.]|nr:MAG: hypothetical protein E5Y50_30700 [Mesorhizobium sp.]
MRRYAATNPTDFAAIDLNDYRDRLSKEAIKELTGQQTTALTDQRKAQEDGLTLTTAFSQAQTQLEAVGLTTTGKEDREREDAAKRIAQFQNALAAQMDEFKRSNKKAPNQMEIQSMINRMLLPVVIRDQTERSMWNPLKTPWSSVATTEREGFMFEAGQRSDNSSVDVVVEYSDIPIDLRRGIAADLEQELGRKPSEDEVVLRYEDFALGRDPTPIVEPPPYDHESSWPNRALQPLSYLPGKALMWAGEEIDKWKPKPEADPTSDEAFRQRNGLPDQDASAEQDGSSLLGLLGGVAERVYQGHYLPNVSGGFRKSKAHEEADRKSKRPAG